MMSAVIGVVLMVLIMVGYLLAGGKEGAMRDMETADRFILSGFTAMLGCLLVLYGLAKSRGLAFLLCLVFGGGLLVMPVIFPGNPTSSSAGFAEALSDDSTEGLQNQPNEDEVGADYLQEIGYAPVAEALKKAPKDSVIAVYLRNASTIVRAQISEYLYEETKKRSRGIAYDQVDKNRNGLILMTDQEVSIDEMATMCGKFGRVDVVHRDYRVIDVTVQNSKIVKLDPSKSLDPDSPDFFRQQLVALRSIDLKLKMEAVKRLGRSEPKAMRDDIAKELMMILPHSQTHLQLEIIKTLRVWSQPGDGGGAVVLDAVKKLHQKGQVDKEAVSFLVEREVDGVQIILMELWNSNPVAWSDLLMGLGEGAQILLLPKLKDMDEAHVVVASDILGKVGSLSCVSHLEEVIGSQDVKGKKSLKAAIDEIKKRF